MARSPVAVGIVLGLVVGAGATAAIAVTTPTTTGSGLSPRASLRHRADAARGYRLGSQPAPGAVERLAAAFDLHAPVGTDAGGWVVRDGDRLLRVQRTGALPWFFSVLDGPCKLVPESPAPGETLQTVPPSGPADCPETAPASIAPADVLSKEDALALGMDTLGRVGVSLSSPAIEDEPGGWYIQATPLVGSRSSVGRPWTITVGPGPTVSAASGYLASD